MAKHQLNLYLEMQMKQLSMIVLCALTIACSSSTTSTNPTAPEPTVTTTPTTPAPQPTPTETPGWTVGGPYPEPSYHCGDTSIPNVLSWVIAVHDSGDAPIHLVATSSHSAKAGCAPTVEETRGRLAVEGPDSFMAHDSGDIGLTYDKHAYDCGRVQLDASFFHVDGGETKLVGVVVDYGKDCEAPKLPPPQPAPPTPPTITPTTSCPAGVTGHITSLTVGGKATATVTVPAGAAMTASFVSYQAAAAKGNRYPQRMFGTQIQTVAAGATGYFTVDVPSCYYQVDLVCGAPITDLSDGNKYDARKLDYSYGGTKSCW